MFGVKFENGVIKAGDSALAFDTVVNGAAPLAFNLEAHFPPTMAARLSWLVIPEICWVVIATQNSTYKSKTDQNVFNADNVAVHTALKKYVFRPERQCSEHFGAADPPRVRAGREANGQVEKVSL